MATISFTNLTVSGNMGFKEISFDAFRRILDFIEAQTHGAIPTGTDLNDLCEGTWKEAEVSIQGKAAEVVVSDGEPTAAKEDEPPKTDPYSLVGNYSGKKSVVGILKAYAENPGGYTQEWLTAKQWMEKVRLVDPAATSFCVAHILADCARVGLLERRADYNPEEHKNEVRFLLPVPVKAGEDVEKEPIAINFNDKLRGAAVRKARQEAGFSIAELAELIGYSVDTIVKWETGIYSISSAAEETLKKAFGKDLFTETEVQ